MTALKATRTEFLTVEEVADLLRISKRSAYRVVKEMVHAEIAGRLVVPAQKHAAAVTWSKRRGVQMNLELIG